MNEGEETRNYGKGHEREYMPIANRDPRQFLGLDKEQRMHYVKLRLFDKFARTGDVRCRDKAKSL